MQIDILDKEIDNISADFEVVFVVNKNLKHEFIKDSKLFKIANYNGEGVFLALENKILYVGINKLDSNSIRLGAFNAYKNLEKLNISGFKIASYFDTNIKDCFVALAEGFVLGSYDFNKYKSNKKNYKNLKITVSSQSYTKEKFCIETAMQSINKGIIIAYCANFAKDGVNEIPQIYTPKMMAKQAQNIAKNNLNIECQIYDEKFLSQEKMNAFLAVSRASTNPPRLIHLSYKPKKPTKRVVFVGKGLTYDSGGLSLKPSDYMLTMKSDKSGALAAMAIIEGASKLNLKIEVHAVLGAAENMIGANAYKPDDVLITRSGKSVEVRNTDAEGRLVLADCLDFAQDLNPDILIDIATLTGACVVGVGEFTSAIMGNSDDLKYYFKKIAQRSGDYFTVLDFNEYLKDLIKSNMADVSNTASSRYGGALTAGLFLENFIKDEYKDKWIHLDIAGPAYLEKSWGYNTFGATGIPVRACLYFLDALKDN